MSFWNGLGGGVVINGGAELPVTRHVVNKTARLTETTYSANTATSYQSVVPDFSWEIEGIWDDTVLPDTDANLTDGTVLTTLVFQDGTSTKSVTLSGTTVESLVETEDVVNDVIRWRATGKGGTITRQVT